MLLRALLLSFALIVAGPASATTTFTTIFKFTGTDGSGPVGPLFRTKAGVLFGAATYGGTKNKACPNGCGTVFKLTPPATGKTVWTRTLLRRFAGNADGMNPFGVQADAAGALFGTTINGGLTSCDGGCGAVYKLAPPAAGKTVWTKTLIYGFNGND